MISKGTRKGSGSDESGLERVDIRTDIKVLDNN